MSNDKESSKETPILYYPLIRGSVQPIRNLFYFLQVEFIQKAISVQNHETGFNADFPKLIHNDMELTDVIAIFRYLSKVYKCENMLGLTPQSRAVINQFLFKYSQICEKIMKKFSEVAKAIWANKKKAQELKMSAIKSILEEECKIIYEYLNLYIKSRTWIIGHITILDFFFYEICYYLVNFFGSAILNHAIYRHLNLYKKMFESQEFYLKFETKITDKKIFLPFQSRSTFEVVQYAWEGDKEVIA